MWIHKYLARQDEIAARENAAPLTRKTAGTTLATGLLTLFLAWGAIELPHRTAWQGACVGMLLYFALQGALTMIARRRAYQDGRLHMYSSMMEAAHRGLTFSEWLDTELERDSVRNGMPPEGLRQKIEEAGGEPVPPADWCVWCQDYVPEDDD